MTGAMDLQHDRGVLSAQRELFPVYIVPTEMYTIDR